MPTTKLKNTLYRLALPLLAPSPRGQTVLTARGRALKDERGFLRLIRRHHVLGASLLLRSGSETRTIDASTTRSPIHAASPDTLYRVASITKTATALVALALCEEGLLSLDGPFSRYLPDAQEDGALRGVTLRHLLSHTSGLRDIPAADETLARGGSYRDVLSCPGVRAACPGATFRYCNFGFGLIGCAMEHVSGRTLETVFQEKLFLPLGLRATLDGAAVERDVMEIVRVLPYRAGQGVRVTALGRRTLDRPDPLRRFGHTAGSLYTDAASLSRMLSLIAQGGVWAGRTLLSAASIAEMTRTQAVYGAASPTLAYGLGLLIIEDRRLSGGRILGHQGFAYGCADGAFYEEDTGRQVVFLNGGASEARDGRLGLCNRDLLAWALRKEMPAWP